MDRCAAMASFNAGEKFEFKFKFEFELSSGKRV
ncbi:hypothetical protein K227x_50320 [Rubripirellula lacrimiformis]|uniref:Uncharacterized protein n=1 Tax=Rubripirellula lacrimiformis TaxID=1930273 RepID=A0A517NHK9_9BACT|nr:hypothetical protein K227x_50320 [Rubripirellula lacrimiformis]